MVERESNGKVTFNLTQSASHKQFYLSTKSPEKGNSCSSTVPDGFMTSRLIPRRTYNPGETLRKYVQVFTNVSKTLVQEHDGVMAGNLLGLETSGQDL